MNTTTYPQELTAGAAILRRTSPTTFEIQDGPQDGQGDAEGFGYGPYFIPDGADLSPVIAILSNPAWTETQINDAVETINYMDPEARAQRRRAWRARMAADFNWHREEVA